MDANPSAKKYRIIWPLFLFGSAFFSAGLTVAWLAIISPYLHYIESQHWPEVPVSIQQLELNPHPGKSITWNVAASYEYLFNGTRYQSKQVSLATGSDSDKQFWIGLYQRLNDAQKQNRAHAYVNPEAPEQAYLDRHLRLKPLVFGGVFAVLFLSIGGIIGYASFYGKNEAYNPDLAKIGIACNERGGYLTLLFIGPFFVLLSTPILLINHDKIGTGIGSILLASFFPVLGSLLTYYGWRLRQRFIKIGPTRFYPDPAVGQIGGQLGGYFHVAQGQWDKAPTVYLTCEHYVQVGTSEHRRVESDILWQGVCAGHWEKKAKGSDVFFCFDVPADLPMEGRCEEYAGNIRWFLFCEGRVLVTSTPKRDPRVDNSLALRRSSWKTETLKFYRSWHVPIEVGTQESSVSMPTLSASEVKQEQEAVYQAACQQLQVNETDGGLQLVNERGRQSFLGWMTLLMGVIFSSLGLFTGYLAAQGDGLLWLIGLLFLPMGLAAFGYGVFVLGRSLVATIHPQEAQMVQLFFGIPLFKRRTALYPNSPVQLDLVFSTTNANNVQQDHFDLSVKGHRGIKITLVQGMAGKEAAEALQHRIRQLLQDAA